MRDLRYRLRRFAEDFALSVPQITGAMIQRYIDGLPVASRSKLNELRHITSVLRWAVRRKYAPRDMLDELGSIERPAVTPSPTLVFTPAELREILAATHHRRPDLVPAVSILAFCGLRSAEVLRLDWSEVKFDRSVVEVVAAKAKTATRRVAPLPDAARAWLAPYAQPSGPVSPVKGENRLYDAVMSTVNVEREARVEKPFVWKRNGLRHAFCSYRLAL